MLLFKIGRMRKICHFAVFEQRAEGGMGARPDVKLGERDFQKGGTVHAKALRCKAGQREERLRFRRVILAT